MAFRVQFRSCIEYLLRVTPRMRITTDLTSVRPVSLSAFLKHYHHGCKANRATRYAPFLPAPVTALSGVSRFADLITVLATVTAVGGLTAVNIFLAWESLGPATSAAGESNLKHPSRRLIFEGGVLANSVHAHNISIIAAAFPTLGAVAVVGIAAIAVAVAYALQIPKPLERAKRAGYVCMRKVRGCIRKAWSSMSRQHA